MWKLLERQGNNDNKQEISFFDVKELYEVAYAEKAKARTNLKAFQVLLDQAETLDQAYRIQLAVSQPFQYGKAA